MIFDEDLIYINGIYLHQLASGLESSRNNLEDEVSKIYKDLEQLKDGWDGDSYRMFRDIMEQHKDSLNSVAVSVSAFQEMLDREVIPAVNEFQDEVCAALGFGSDSLLQADEDGNYLIVNN